MGIPYRNIIFAVLVRTNQLGDAIDAAALETLYTGGVTAAIGGMDLPKSEIKRMILGAEKRVASVCARQKNPILWGQMNFGAEDVDSGDVVVAQSDFVGTFHSVIDSVTEEALTEKTVQFIAQCNRLFGTGFLPIRPTHYAFAGGRLYHTRPNSVYVEGCIWNYATRAAAYDALGNSPLAQEVEDWWIAEALAMAQSEGWYANESTSYANLAGAARSDAQQGAVPSAILPDTNATDEPVKN